MLTSFVIRLTYCIPVPEWAQYRFLECLGIQPPVRRTWITGPPTGSRWLFNPADGWVSWADREGRTPQGAMAMEASYLREHEKFWTNNSPHIAICGYTLRARHRAGWSPSFQYTLFYPDETDDAIVLPDNGGRPVIDATRAGDRMLVRIHRVSIRSQHAQMAMLCSSAEMAQYKENRCIPVLDIFEDEDGDPDMLFIVTPFLRPFDSPPFELVDDVLVFVDQILQGINFLHQRGVTHGDITPESIMMDARVLFPDGFHPISLDRAPGLWEDAWSLPRILFSDSVKYCFVDFEASHVDAQMFDYARGLTAKPGLMDNNTKHAMQEDIHSLGTVLRERICEKYANTEFLRPLVNAMTCDPPEERPNASETLDIWRSVRRGLLRPHRFWRLRPRGEALWVHELINVVDLAKLAVLFPAKPFLHNDYVYDHVAALVTQY